MRAAVRVVASRSNLVIVWWLVQMALMGRLIEPLLLRRQRSQVGAAGSCPPVSTVEVMIPLDLSHEQRECYRINLIKYYDVLADPRPPRHAGHRAAQMRTVCGELRKVGLLCPSCQA